MESKAGWTKCDLNYTQIRQSIYYKHQLNKAAQEPFKAGPDLTELSDKVKYLGGVLDNTLNFESHVSLKVQKAMANFIKIKSIHKYITRSLLHIGTNALHVRLVLQ